MGIFRNLFGGGKPCTEREPENEGQAKVAPETNVTKATNLEMFAQHAMTSARALDAELSDIPAVLDALKRSYSATHPGAGGAGDVKRIVEDKLQIACPKCGPLRTQVILQFFDCVPPGFNVGAIMGSGLVAVRCPGCNGTRVKVTFNGRA